jgi:hypothetical protein
MKHCKAPFHLILATMIAALSGTAACGESDSAETTSDAGGATPSTKPSGDPQSVEGSSPVAEPSDAGTQGENHAPLVTIFTAGGTGNMFDINGTGVIPLGITPVPAPPSNGGGGETASSGGGTTPSGAVTLTPAQASLMDAVGYALITTTHDFNWVPINYPSAAFPMNQSVATGVATLIAQIKALPPGSPFVLEGMSQGAIVTSRVLDEIRNGSLKEREADLLAGITFGNPCREAGHLWPGAVDPGAFDNGGIPGHGIMATCRLSNTPAYWWDFANARDPATTAGDDPAGRLLTAVFEILFTNVVGPGSVASLVQTAFTNLGFDLGLLPGIVNTVNELALFASPSNPHAQYWSVPPQANPPTTLSSAQVAIQYLAGVGATWRNQHRQ